MRQLVRLLQPLRKTARLQNYESTKTLPLFDELVAAVKGLCGFNKESRLETQDWA